MQYWANKRNEEIIDDLKTKIEDYDKYLSESGILQELRDSYRSFYGDSKIRNRGSQGELKGIKVNHYASLVRNLVALVTNNKPAWQPIASNTDSESQSSTILASGLLDFYMKDRRLDRVFRNACLMACILKEGWVSATWSTQMGEVIAVDPDTMTPLHEGDLKYSSFQINNIIRDYRRKDQEHDWLITREFLNRYDLIAQYPDHRLKIEAITLEKHQDNQIRPDVRSYGEEDEDSVELFTLYHKQTAAVPNGKFITFIEGQVLVEGPLPYQKIPLVRISAEDLFETSFGHSPMFDVLPLQEAMDALASTLLTNNVQFGVQNVQYPKGSAVSVSQIAGGLNLIEYDPKHGPLQPLQLTASAPETYKFFEILIQQSQLLSGVNDAIRGQTSAGTSGAALALLSQQAIQFANGLQQGFVSLIEDVGTLSIQILQQYANTKRVAVLTGKHNSPLLKEWSSADLRGISRITIESGNALSKTASGRLTMADSLLNTGMIKRPEQYISVLTTGQLEPLYENEQAQLLLIRKENEALAEGQAVRALLTDDHSSHILEHASVLSNPDIRKDVNSPVIINTLEHIQEHLTIGQNLPPGLAMMLKQQPLPPSAPPPGQNVTAPGDVAPVMNGENSVITAGGEVNLPSMPKDPRTGEQYNPTTA